MAAGKTVRTSAISRPTGQMYGWGQGPTGLASARAGTMRDGSQTAGVGLREASRSSEGLPVGRRVWRGRGVLRFEDWFEDSKLGNHTAPRPHDLAPFLTPG